MRSKTATAAFLAIVLLLFSATLQAEITYMQAKVFYDSEDRQLELRAMGLDIVISGEDYFEIITYPEEFERIQGLGFQTELIHADLVDFYQSRLDPTRDMGGYWTLSEIYAHVDSIIAEHPDIVSAKISLGQTIEGRDMWAFKISDNPEIDEDEPEVLFTSAIHAREVITPLVVLHFVDHITDNYATDPDIQELIDSREIWIVPVVNPDGYYHNEVIAPGGGGMWRKNRRDNGDGTFGVDLNRNYGYMWGYNNYGSSPDPSSLTYRGTGPFSEPESQNMRDFHIAHEFEIVVYFHSYSNIFYTAWGYDNSYPEDFDIFNYIVDSARTWNGYANGVGVAGINGCTDDWCYGERTLKGKEFGLTWEVGGSEDGFWPIPARIPFLIEENLGACMFVARAAGRIDSLYKARPPQVPDLTAPELVEELNYDVTWTFEDTLNPAVAFELSELMDHQTLIDQCDDFGYCLENNGFEVTTERAHSGPSSFYCGEDMVLMRYFIYEIPLQVQVGDSIKFWTYYDMGEHTDYGFVYAIGETHEGAIPGNISTTDNWYGYNWGHGITGQSGGWVEGLFDLSDYVGEHVLIAFVFSYHTLGLVEGIYFDDIQPIHVFNGENIYPIAGEDRLFNFTDKPDGEYFYRMRAQDAEDQWSPYSFISQTTVQIPTYICGDPNGDEDVNVSDAVYIINYVFAGGNPPDPMESGDTNCDETVNVSDAVLIINYVFMGGNYPCDTDGNGIPDC
jgi:murein tripeptide amidase MpaA